MKFSLDKDSQINPRVFIADNLNSISFESHALHKVEIKFGHSFFLINNFSIEETKLVAE